MAKKQTFIPNITDVKILETVFLLNQDSYFPLNEGVIKILMGMDDKETLEFKDIITYGAITSYSAKKISRHIMMLLRYKYLTKKLDINTNELYLAITTFGVNFLLEYKKHHHINYSKKEINIKKTIVKIDN